MTFSSTVIIVKLLFDKREIDTLHGRIAVGFLIVKKAVTAHSGLDVDILRESGVDLILFPFADAAKEAAEMLAVDRNSSERK